MKVVKYSFENISVMKTIQLFRAFFIRSGIKVAQKQEILVKFAVFMIMIMGLSQSRWLDIKLLLGLHEPLMNHFRFLKFNSLQKDSMLKADLSLRNF